MQTTLNRRRALAVVAAVPAAAALATPTLASVGEDAELLRLWEEWNANNLLCRDAYNEVQEIESKVWQEAGPVWELAKLDITDRTIIAPCYFKLAWRRPMKAVPIRLKVSACTTACDGARGAPRTADAARLPSAAQTPGRESGEG
jgi:hypothetical protein